MITVLTAPRTGSTWFCEYLSNLHNLTNLDEFFEDDKWNSPLAQAQGLTYLEQTPNIIFKVFPNHLLDYGDKLFGKHTSRRPNFSKNVLELQGKKYILTRKDFYAQCKSHYIASITLHFSGKPRKTEHLIFNAFWWNRTVDYLTDCYTILGQYNKEYDCEIIDYSELSFTTTPQSKKYIRPVTWDQEPPVPDIDISKFFD